MIHAALFNPVFLAQVATDVERDAHWQIQADWPWAPWVTVLVVVAAIAVVMMVYARESSPAGAAYRSLLGLLRLTTVGLVLVMLSGLLMSATHTGLPRLVVLVDHSSSMDLGIDSDDATRLNAAKDWLLADDAALLQTWTQRYQLEVRAIADGEVELPGETPKELAASILEVATDAPRARQSRLGDALASAVEATRGSSPAAIILATDGRTTAGKSLDEGRELARQRGVPVFALGLGPTDAPSDLRLTNLMADDAAMVGDLVAIGVTVEATNVAGESARVVARNAATGKIEAEKIVSLTSQRHSEQIKLLVRANQTGEAEYELEVLPQANERDTSNNRLKHAIDVREETVSVLLAAGYPSYEFRYLKNLLDRDTTFQLLSYLQEADIDYAQQDATAITQLPLKKEQMDSFDVLVLLDLNPRFIPPSWWLSVERHVMENRGGLVLIAGPRFFPWQYENVAGIRKLAPIQFDGLGGRRGQNHTGYQPRLTPLGINTAAMQLAGSPDRSLQIWRGLAPHYWYANIVETKPSATVLATHPSATTVDSRPLPIIASQYVGAGRVLYHGFDSSWRWRFRVGDVFFARYWGQTLRFLARSKVLAGEQKPEILVEQDKYQLGEAVRVRLRLGSAATNKTQQSGAELLLEADGQPRRRIELTESQLAAGMLQATIRNLPPDRYRLALGEPVLANAPNPIEFTVNSPPGEMADITMNAPALEELATATYGNFYTIDNVGKLADDLPKGEPVVLEGLPPYELWNKWWMLLAITACLTTEWILRKRRAML